MDTILLCSSHVPLVTSIHNTFIEKYMLAANGSYVKVYLYLSKCIQAGEDDLSISSLADRMENTEKDIIRALNYWEKQHLMQLTRSEDKTMILGIELLDPDTLSAAAPAAQKGKASASDTSSDRQHTTGTQTAAPDNTYAATLQENEKAQPQASIEASQTASLPSQVHTDPATAVSPAASSSAVKHSFTVSAEQTKRLTADEEFGWTCNVIESYLERPIKSNEMQFISYLYDTMHFSSELIIYLYEYCISLGKTNVSYLQTVAIAWDEKKIRTPEEAETASADYSSNYNAISKALALGRSLAAIEKKYVERWQNEWKIDLSVILEACNRTMLKIHKADFKYTEGILDNWHKAGVHTLQDVQKADAAYAQKKAEAQKKNAGQRTGSYQNRQTYNTYVQHGLSQDDAQALEKRLLNI